MRTMSMPFVLGFLLALICLPPLHAQMASNAPNDARSTTAGQTPTGQAPDDMTKKITDLVHAGKYTEAQKLTEGLLIAYPDDQRLIKAKALIDKLLAPGGSASAAPASHQPTQPVPNATTEQLTGLDKVDY